MHSAVTDPGEYITNLPAARYAPVSRLRSIINEHLPEGFKETMAYGMLTWVVPFSLYPPGYHCNPEQQLPFLSLASQKNYISFYHMGLYAVPELMNWLTTQNSTAGSPALDMGKSCIRFKWPEKMPFSLLGELCQKMTPLEWIAVYEKNYRR